MPDTIRKTVYDSDSGPRYVLEDCGSAKRVVEEEKTLGLGLVTIAVATACAVLGALFGIPTRR